MSKEKVAKQTTANGDQVKNTIFRICKILYWLVIIIEGIFVLVSGIALIESDPAGMEGTLAIMKKLTKIVSIISVILWALLVGLTVYRLIFAERGKYYSTFRTMLFICLLSCGFIVRLLFVIGVFGKIEDHIINFKIMFSMIFPLMCIVFSMFIRGKKQNN